MQLSKGGLGSTVDLRTWNLLTYLTGAILCILDSHFGIRDLVDTAGGGLLRFYLSYWLKIDAV